jgi:NTE family protein
MSAAMGGSFLDQPLALVLSGGSVRAAAHVGVLKALAAYKLQPDMVVGTSGGAIVAALYARGLDPAELEALFLQYRAARRQLVDLNWPGFLAALLRLDIKYVSGVVRGRALERLIKEQLGEVQHFDQLGKVQLLIPTVNLNTGQQVVFCDYRRLGIPLENGEYANFQVRDHLTIAQAVRASISIPGVFVPAAFPKASPGDCYVDGGVRNGYPLTVAVKLGRARQIIGVNLGYAGMRREAVCANGPFEVLSQSLDIMMRGQYRDILGDADVQRCRILTINPLIYDIGTFEVEYIPEMIARGCAVAERLLVAKGLSPKNSGEQNRRLLFAGVRGAETFPLPGTAYFQELLDNQIKGRPGLPLPPKPNLWEVLYRTIRGKKMELG